MTRSCSTLLVLLSCLFFQATAPAADDKAELKALLTKSGEDFLAVIDNVNEEQWNFKGSGLRHSIGEEAEHICFAEQDLQRVIHSALRADADPERAKALQGKEEKVRALFLEGEQTAENFKVRGRINSKLEVLEYFPMAHGKLMDLLAAAKDLDNHIYKHPSEKYGELTARQWFYYIAYHKERHIQQIEAIKAHPDYPGRVRTATHSSRVEDSVAEE